jgi:diacylglycerol kinase family enzyme
MTNNNKWIFIVNPTSGGGYGREIIPELEKQLSTESLKAEIVLTEKHGHATELS